MAKHDALRGTRDALSPRAYARKHGYLTYHGSTCAKCGNTEKYVKYGRCVACAKAQTARRVESGDFRKYYTPKTTPVDPTTRLGRRYKEPHGPRRVAAAVGSSPASEQITYLIDQDGGPLCKIGVSTRMGVKDRLRTLQTKSPHPLRIVGTLEGNHEAEIHDKFSAHRVFSEWFLTNDEILSEFAEATA